jgi:hypothetical protein
MNVGKGSNEVMCITRHEFGMFVDSGRSISGLNSRLTEDKRFPLGRVTFLVAPGPRWLAENDGLVFWHLDVLERRQRRHVLASGPIQELGGGCSFFGRCLIPAINWEPSGLPYRAYDADAKALALCSTNS